MTTADLRALLDAAAAATPGPVRNSQCGLEECAGKRECTLCVAQRTYDPAKALAAAASPDTICKLCRIALAAVNMTENGIVKEYRSLRAALRDTGLI